MSQNSSEHLKFVFYDVETTGLNLEFDQIIQFAAVLTDANFCEIDRINIRCRRLPWVIPSPKAMIVTGMTPEDLENEKYLSFPEMVHKVFVKLKSWSPAYFIGYNSFSFDEIFLHRAFWQVLLPPYLTISDSNRRLDILPIVRAVSKLTPHALTIPGALSGKPSFKLDKLAPLNGFGQHKAHDALGDVYATIHLAQKISNRSAHIWKSALDGAEPGYVDDMLAEGKPVFVAEPTSQGKPGWWAVCINQQKVGSTRYLFPLQRNWEEFFSASSEQQSMMLKVNGFNPRSIKLTKSPMLFSYKMAESIFGISPSKAEMDTHRFLTSLNEGAERVFSKPWNQKNNLSTRYFLEQQIYDGFPDNNDQNRMEEFHKSSWSNRVNFIRKFKDKRYQQLAQRLVFVTRPDTLDAEDIQRINDSIQERLSSPSINEAPWRGIEAAREELFQMIKMSDERRTLKNIDAWLEKLS